MTTYEIKIKTGDRLGSGTNANIEIVLFDGSGKHTKPAKLDNLFRDDFERGHLDVFTIKDETDIPEVTEIKLRRDTAGRFSDWFVDQIEVLNKNTKITSIFPVLRWIRPKVDLFIGRHDTFLPQFDPRLQQRNAELQEKRTLYEYEERIPGLPVQIKNVPEDEEYSISRKWDIATKILRLRVEKGLDRIFGCGRWETFDDLTSVYTSYFERPKAVDDWKRDESFGWQRLNSVNPNLIYLCTEIPTKFGVTEDDIASFLEGLTISEAISEKRLFLIDLEILDGVTCFKEYVCPAPIALFFVNDKGQLMPVAIQLFQQKGPDNPVFLPSDPPYTWLFAKMWYNVADTSYHQSISHLGCTHLLMEGICIASNRCLSPSHPMFKLLAPHFLYHIAVNDHSLSSLIDAGGIFDTTMAIGHAGALELIIKGVRKWRMNVDGIYPELLKSKGVYCKDGSILPTFYQRDDMLTLYEAIHGYVTKYVNFYYDTSDKIIGDNEIQTFGQELTKSKSDGGCGILGVPFKNGRFTSAEQLTIVFTSIIFTSTVGHSAVNTAQYDTYGFPPNYPTRLDGAPPKNKSPLTEEDIVKCVVDRETTIEVMSLAVILSEKIKNALGDFEVNYTYDPAAVKIVEEFRKELKDIGQNINQRNEKLERKFEYLHPEEIPNSVSL
uniref:Allene oxide synthase-lipoxygenase protein n=1 Tax=Magallana gigas TaxID=29159 RepID=A0A8W8HT92_MAGGI